MTAIDEAARRIAIERYALPACLHVPVAARDEKAVATYVGRIARVLSAGEVSRALLVHVMPPPVIDERLPIWTIAGAETLHRSVQVWVDISYTRYRVAYKKAFPEENIAGKVLSHAMNRRTAAAKGFRYVRLTPTSRGANSSSAFSESWAVALHSQPDRRQASQSTGPHIQYADLCDLMLLLDMRVGGGVMGLVNEAQRLVTPQS